MSPLVCGLFSNSIFQVLPQKIVRRFEILGIKWLGVIGLTWNESVPWEVMPEVFIFLFCSRNEADLISRTEYLITSGITSHGIGTFRVKPITSSHPIPKTSTRLRGGNWKTEFVKAIHWQERTSSERKSDEFHKKCSIELWIILMFELLLCYHTAARCMERT